MAQDEAPKKKLRRGVGNRTPYAKDVQAKAERKERRRRVFEMKLAGASYREVGRALGISFKQAQLDFQRELDEPPPGAEEYRRVQTKRREREVVRLNDMGAPLRKRLEANPNDLEAQKLLIDLSAAKAKHMAAIESMNVRKLPEQHEHSGPGGAPIAVASAQASWADIVRLMAENEKKAGS
jgi:hypothetical protein